MAKVSVDYPKNPSRYSLPSVMGLVCYFDPVKGAPLAIMDSAYISALRTSAHGSLGVKYLSGLNSRVVGVLGSGVQARMGLVALREVRPSIDEVYVYSRTKAHREAYVESMSSLLGMNIVATSSSHEAVRNADIVYCATYSHEPLVKYEWLKEGSHLSTVGSYEEVDSEIYRRAKIVVHNKEIAKTDGAVAHWLKKGVIKELDIYADIAELILGEKIGRDSTTDITLYVATGMPMLDAVCAQRIYEKATSIGVGRRIRYEPYRAF